MPAPVVPDPRPVCVHCIQCTGRPSTILGPLLRTPISAWLRSYFGVRSTVKFTVIGAGAIGGTVGAHLARSGHDVLLCDADAAHVAAINEHGLRITGPVEEFTVRVPAVLPSELSAHLDGVVLVSVKTQHTQT